MKTMLIRQLLLVVLAPLARLHAQINYPVAPYTFTTLAGASGLGSVDGTGSAARFNKPNAVAADSSGNLYIADTFNHVIRKFTPLGFVTTLAGSPGNSGLVDDIGGAARFNSPGGITVDASGNVFVADSGNHVRKTPSPACATSG